MIYGDRRTFTARICQPRRDTMTHIPKRLLTTVLYEDGTEFRDHCWINEKDSLLPFYPKYNKEVVIIQFTARTKSYGIEDSYLTLAKIRDIRIVKRFKKGKENDR